MRLFSAVLVAALAIAVVATAGSTSKSAPATAQTLRQLEADFMNAAATRGAEGYMAYYADDAVELPNGTDALNGKAAIAKTMGFLNNKDNRLSWTPSYAELSGSGDLGYTYGTYEFRSRDKDGKPIVSYGKYTTIWKKQKDGAWKVILDMGNDSPTPK
jgi:ketosteroid isomerase-like protein